MIAKRMVNEIQQLRYEVEEEVDVGHVIGNILEDSGLLDSMVKEGGNKDKGQKKLENRKSKMKKTSTRQNRYRNKSNKNVESNKHQRQKKFLKNVSFRFLAEPNIAIGLNNKNGVLKTIGRIDREGLCGSLSECSVSFDVVVQPMNVFRTFKVTLDVIDVNDHVPTFKESRK